MANTWRDYHEWTKHSVASLARSPHYLDWANMPNPFRHYEGVPVLDLPADPVEPQTPALDVLRGTPGSSANVADGPSFLSMLLFHAAAISASKVVPSTGYRYALRVNPSSGNLHPTEFHFVTRGLPSWPDGLYHYRPSSHMAEQRAAGDIQIPGTDPSAPVTFVLTSIALRESWKYRDRAYRYCLHDIGHAWQALALAARAMGCETRAVGHFADDSVAEACRFPDDEWPMLLVELQDLSIPTHARAVGTPVWYSGTPNSLAEDVADYPRIDRIHSATKLPVDAGPIARAEPAAAGSGDIHLPAPAASTRPFGKVVRQRRSALDFVGGTRSMTSAQLAAILAAATEPLDADFAASRFISLYAYVHRVDGMEPGVYRVWQNGTRLERIRSGDQRVVAAGLSLGQDLAGNACIAFSVIADIERAVRAHGNRGYRYVFFEAGAIGHRLYLAAEALGMGATGIGAFYDDRVHEYLNVRAGEGQVVYHFSIGYPVHDDRVEA